MPTPRTPRSPLPVVLPPPPLSHEVAKTVAEFPEGSNANEACLRMLLERGADVNQAANDGRTALHNAARNANEACLQMLLERGADVNHAANDGRTALHNAARNANEACLRFLLERGADVNLADRDGMTAVHYAASSESEACLRMLLERGADVNQAANDGRTALHYAARNANEACLRFLLERGADVNHAANDGRTALHHAARNANEACLQFLLERGADVNLADRDGMTAVHYAASNENEACLRLLLRQAIKKLENSKATPSEERPLLSFLAALSAEKEKLTAAFCSAVVVWKPLRTWLRRSDLTDSEVNDLTTLLRAVLDRTDPGRNPQLRKAVLDFARTHPSDGAFEAWSRASSRTHSDGSSSSSDHSEVEPTVRVVQTMKNDSEFKTLVCGCIGIQHDVTHRHDDAASQTHQFDTLSFCPLHKTDDLLDGPQSGQITPIGAVADDSCVSTCDDDDCPSSREEAEGWPKELPCKPVHPDAVIVLRMLQSNMRWLSEAGDIFVGLGFTVIPCCSLRDCAAMRRFANGIHKKFGTPQFNELRLTYAFYDATTLQAALAILCQGLDASLRGSLQIHGAGEYFQCSRPHAEQPGFPFVLFAILEAAEQRNNRANVVVVNNPVDAPNIQYQVPLGIVVPRNQVEEPVQGTWDLVAF